MLNDKTASPFIFYVDPHTSSDVGGHIDRIHFCPILEQSLPGVQSVVMDAPVYYIYFLKIF